MINFWRLFFLVGGLSLVLVGASLSYARRSDPAPRLAFLSDRAGSLDLYLVKPDGTDLVNVSHSPHLWEENFWWSPNGAWLVYEAYGGANYTSQLYTAHANGSHPRRVSQPHLDSYSPFWSPASNFFLFSAWDSGSNTSHLQRVSPTGHRLRPAITNTLAASSDLYKISPTGHWMTMIVYGNQTDLYWVDLHRGEAVSLGQFGDIGMTAWLPPTGEWIYFDAFEPNTGFYDLFRIRPDGSDLENVSRSPTANEYLMGITPDGNWLMLEVEKNHVFSLEWWTLTGETRKHVLGELNPYDQPRWSPNGQWMTLVSYENDNLRLHLITASGDLAYIHPPLTGTLLPVWSPDSQWLAFVASTETGNSLFRMRPDGSDWLNLTPHPPANIIAGHLSNELPSLAWSPDGQWLTFPAFQEDNEDIYIVRADGSEIRNLSASPAYDTYPQWGKNINLPWRAGWVLLAGLGMGVLGVLRARLASPLPSHKIFRAKT